MNIYLAKLVLIKKSIAFKVTIQSLEKTLDEKDLEQIHQNIIDKVSIKFDAKIRS